MQDADARAAEAMRNTEVVVKDELEAAAVYAQVKQAVEAASKSLAQLHAVDEEVELPTETIDISEPPEVCLPHLTRDSFPAMLRPLPAGGPY